MLAIYWLVGLKYKPAYVHWLFPADNKSESLVVNSPASSFGNLWFKARTRDQLTCLRFPVVAPSLLRKTLEYTVTWWRVTIDGVWVVDRIYWTLWYSVWLHFTVHSYTHTLVSTVMSSLPLLGSGFQQLAFSFLQFPELSPGSATSF
jgi:hypothetical protein